jgi:hypothetical protein
MYMFGAVLCVNVETSTASNLAVAYARTTRLFVQIDSISFHWALML